MDYLNITQEYIDKAKPGEGLIEYEPGLFSDPHKPRREEQQAAEWLRATFGGDIMLLAEIERTLTPDYLWRGKLWDLKTPLTDKENTIENRISHGLKQIFDTPRPEKAGGLILDFSKSPLTLSQAVGIALDKTAKRKRPLFDLIICKAGSFFVFRING